MGYVSCSLSTLVLHTGFITESGVQTVSLNWLLSEIGGSTHNCFPRTAITDIATMIRFYMDAGDLDLSPHVSRASTSPPEPLPQLPLCWPLIAGEKKNNVTGDRKMEE